MTNTNSTTAINYRTFIVPANVAGPAESLIEGIVGSRTTGLCRTIGEAQERAAALAAGREPATQAPDYQANEREMATAAKVFETMQIRDGGLCQRTIEDALKAGIHTVEWALASRYLVAGWVSCS